MIWHTTHPATSTVRDAIEYLSSACDGAVRHDGHGFGSEHVALGHDLAVRRRWGPTRRSRAKRLVLIYRQQLSRAGFDPDQILGTRPPQLITRRHARRLPGYWAPDPTGVHHRRYWNGARWTQLVG